METYLKGIETPDKDILRAMVSFIPENALNFRFIFDRDKSEIYFRSESDSVVFVSRSLPEQLQRLVDSELLEDIDAPGQYQVTRFGVRAVRQNFRPGWLVRSLMILDKHKVGFIAIGTLIGIVSTSKTLVSGPAPNLNADQNRVIAGPPILRKQTLKTSTLPYRNNRAVAPTTLPAGAPASSVTPLLYDIDGKLDRLQKETAALCNDPNNLLPDTHILNPSAAPQGERILSEYEKLSALDHVGNMEKRLISL